ncbi:MAG: hypothetical protein QM702_03630 [Rubrivivax sp.]
MDAREPMEEGSVELAEMRERFRADWRGVLTDKATLPKYRTVVWSRGERLFADDDGDRADRIATEVEDVKDAADPWLWHAYMGQVEIKCAWKAARQRLGQHGDRRGLCDFRAHLQLAQAHFKTATEIDDKLPHPYAGMITVSMGESTGDHMALWRKAIERQIDYMPAYEAYRQAIRPRWGGTVPEMLRLANWCVATKRFDTAVPGQVISIIWDLQSEYDAPLNLCEMATLGPLVQRAMDGYLAYNSDVPDNWISPWRKARRSPGTTRWSNTSRRGGCWRRWTAFRTSP